VARLKIIVYQSGPPKENGWASLSGVFEGVEGEIAPQEFLYQDNFYISNGYFIKKQKL
jgi:hypothetical protein